MPDFESRVGAILNRLARQLIALDWRIVTAESCTGGWIAKCCTDVSGSSAWFERAYIAYSYRAKEEMLGVSHEDLIEHGAVSEEIARQMAVGARQRSHAEAAIGVTGIAGPGGGMPGKPVGLVYFGWCIADRPAVCDAKVFTGDRDAVRRQTVLHALEGLLVRLTPGPRVIVG